MSADLIKVRAMAGTSRSLEGGKTAVVVQTILGCVKLGDLVSDIVFIHTISRFDQFFGDAVVEADDGSLEMALNATAILVCSIIFTLIGLAFDSYKAHRVFKIYQEHTGLSWGEAFCDIFTFGRVKGRFQEGENGKVSADALRTKLKEITQQKRWWRYNIFYEEIPQCFILMGTVGSILDSSHDCDLEEVTCTEEQREYYNGLVVDSSLSLVFTMASVMLCIHFYIRIFCTCCKSNNNNGNGSNNSNQQQFQQQPTPDTDTTFQQKGGNFEMGQALGPAWSPAPFATSNIQASQTGGTAFPTTQAPQPPSRVCVESVVTESFNPDGTKVIVTESIYADGSKKIVSRTTKNALANPSGGIQ